MPSLVPKGRGEGCPVEMLCAVHPRMGKWDLGGHLREVLLSPPLPLCNALLPLAVRLRSQGFLRGAVQRQEVQELPVLCGTRLAGGHLRLPLGGGLQAWWDHSRLLGNPDARGGVGLRRGHEEDHQNSSVP